MTDSSGVQKRTRQKANRTGKKPVDGSPRRPASSAAPAAASDAAPRPPATEDLIHEWIELFPHGISVGTNLGRPVLILKDQSGAEVHPVWMNTVDAGVALAELSAGGGSSPHAVAVRLLEAFEYTLDTCAFVDLVGHHQFVNLTFVGKADRKTIRLRAEEAMSFCLQARARFFSTKPLMARCRDLDANLDKFEESLSQGLLPALRAELEISSKKHPYVM